MNALLVVFAALLVSACGTPPARPDQVRERISDELAQAVSNRKSRENAEMGVLAPLTVAMPQHENGEPRFDLSVVNAPAAQVFMAIVTGTRYNMLVGPEVTGSITVNLKDVTVKEALESIRELYGYEFNIKGNRIAIQPNTLQTRVFQVNYLASRRQGATELRVTSSSITGSSGAPGGTSTPSTGGTPIPAGTGGGSTQSGNPTSQVQTYSNTDFWKDLKEALAVIVPGPGTVVVNHISGVVLVRGLPSELRAVEQYLKANQIMVERQVMLEAKILDVQLSEKFQNGINWASFNGTNNRVSLGTSAPGTLLQPSGGTVLNGTIGGIGSREVFGTPGVAGSIVATALGGGFAGLALQTANFAALLSFLETQGTVSVLSSPRIATINNQKAVLKVGTDELFVTNISSTQTTTTTGTQSTPNITLQPYFSGISLDVTPQIDDDGNIILHVHPAISKVEEKEKIIDLGDLGVFKLPLASSSVNETDSIVRVQDGNIVAIGGLMTQGHISDRSGLAGTLNSPGGALVGQRGSTMTKRELVVLLKSTIIHDERSWMKDLEQSSERMRSFGLPANAIPPQ
jgi:MSHA biogenesis protein MshL